MIDDLTGKKVMVIGAGGSVGSALMPALLDCKAVVAPVFRTRNNVAAKFLASWGMKIIDGYFCDVTYDDQVEHTFRHVQGLDGLVYAVGHCPSHGFNWSIGHPLSALRVEVMRSELAMHVWGLHNILHAGLALNSFNVNAKIVVVSSAITRTTVEGKLPPPYLHAGYYAAAIAAMNELVRFARIDPLILDKTIKLQLLSFDAIDTSFHLDTPKRMRPPALLPLSAVIDDILTALISDEVIDKILLAQPALTVAKST